MAIDLTMPALSPTMEKGTLAKWLVSEGDAVKPGDILAEIETDKATMEFEAVEEGRIARLIVPEGTEDVAVGTVLATFAEEGEGIEKIEPAEQGEAIVESAKPATAAPPQQGTIAETKAALPKTNKPVVHDTSVNASPLARRIAAIRDIALGSITGTGPQGKITKADLGVPKLVQAPAQGAPTAAVSPPTIIAPRPKGVPVQTVKLSSMRKTIAKRLTEAKQSVPQFYLTARCNLDALLKLRTELNSALAPRGVKLSVNDMLVKALALALIEVPDANVQFGGDELHRFSRVDISMAVAIEGGLITPVIHDVGALSLSAIAQASRMLAEKARTGMLTPEDYQGGTASISNLGMFGIDEMYPVINPPQALILGVAAGIEQPWKVDGQLGLATIMAATGSFDHRAIDGAVASQFMAAFREIVETPILLIA